MPPSLEGKLSSPFPERSLSFSAMSVKPFIMRLKRLPPPAFSPARSPFSPTLSCFDARPLERRSPASASSPKLLMNPDKLLKIPPPMLPLSGSLSLLSDLRFVVIVPSVLLNAEFFCLRVHGLVIDLQQPGRLGF